MADTDERSRTSGADLPLMAHVARKYYLGGLSKSDIAAQLFLSRFKVARLLDEAREQGVVQIHIGLPGDINIGLGEELQAAYRLRRAVVIDDLDDAEHALFSRLGAATLMLLADLLSDGDTVGVASTRTMMGLEGASAPLPTATFVQLTGALPRGDAVDVISAIRSLTRMANGRARVFYAPMVASSFAARDSCLAQPETQLAFESLPEFSVFITGVGDWSPGLSLIHDALDPDMRKQASERGAVAEIVGVPIDAEGHTVHCDARDRIVAPDIERLRSTRDRIGVVFDPRKARASHIAMTAGLINTVVTHRAHAEALLEL